MASSGRAACRETESHPRSAAPRERAPRPYRSTRPRFHSPRKIATFLLSVDLQLGGPQLNHSSSWRGRTRRKAESRRAVILTPIVSGRSHHLSSFVGWARANLAEGVGFEPTVRSTHNGFRDRPIRPLSHPSGRAG